MYSTKSACRLSCVYSLRRAKAFKSCCSPLTGTEFPVDAFSSMIQACIMCRNLLGVCERAGIEMMCHFFL
ncbi:hypothetical protein HanIR_Chr16g0823491 [Helianthus annuus]|nr:hypothetical protein HanIR_Chr16g0823491 [Helianthus annuus]